MGLYSGGLIIGRIFASDIWGAYFREGLFFWGGDLSEILRYLIFTENLGYLGWRGGGGEGITLRSSKGRGKGNDLLLAYLDIVDQEYSIVCLFHR